ncbi:MAG TPA: hypothetical protein VG366_03165 [Solirubrobacteraceae bacterium]|jgi:hypothetical protein|nr:hypothetical protein [Solirubrobacteraceae bacterium]
MPPRFFVFVQLEFPWALGPADGRYLLRQRVDAEPERVVVLGTLSAGRASPAGAPGGGGLLARLGARSTSVVSSPEPAPVTTSRVTVIDPISLSAEHQARAWLTELDREREVLAAVAVVNRVVHSHRISSADPYVHEVSPEQAIVIRVGWGEGEQVASGRWLHARELRWQPRGRRSLRSRRSRASVLRPQERLAALLGARADTLLCEELTLRARLDLDQGRLRLAALELDSALATAVAELRRVERQDLAIRVAELEQLRAGVSEQARAATLDGELELDRDALAHALGRLEAALRARTAPGISVG